jgi:protein-disulfide isomerase
MIVFADFECPFCGRFTREVLPIIEQEYLSTGRLQLVYHHFPLPSHRNAVSAAVAADCAGQQGRFWDMHDKLFSAGQSLDLASTKSSAWTCPESGGKRKMA